MDYTENKHNWMGNGPNTWVPVPDLTYVSFERLSADWCEDAPCPIPADLVIEIISPDQSFGDMAEKAADYIAAGVLRVWVFDPKARTLTVFKQNALPATYRHQQKIEDALLPDVSLTVEVVFQTAGVPLQRD